jgi:hypothetical protein
MKLLPISATALLALSALVPVAGAQTTASFPFFDGFETGVLEPYWTVTVDQGAGQAQVTNANGPYSGNFHLTIDGPTSGGSNRIFVDLAVDLEGQSGLVLTFAWRDYDDDFHKADGIFISDNGVDFAEAMHLDVSASNLYKLFTIDLDKAVGKAGMGYTSPFYIRLSWEDNFNIPTDGFGFDDISLTSVGYTKLAQLQSATPAIGGEFGVAMDSVADLDGDGIREVAVGHPGYSFGAGKVEVFSGQSSELISTVNPTLNGIRFGRALAAVGDLNGDGFDELLIGAPFDDSAGTDAGAAFLFSTKTGALLSKLTGTLAGDEFGSQVAAAPDLNGDGIGELFVSAPKADGQFGVDAGRGFVFSGADNSLLLTLEGPQVGAMAGQSIDVFGDMTGDGIVDFVMGTPDYDLLPVLDNNIGGAFIYSGVDGALARTLVGSVQDGGFGTALAALEDVTGDGILDLAVGSPEVNGAQGLVRFFDSAAGLFIKDEVGFATNDRFGAALTRAGDMDGDGTVELVVGTDPVFPSAKGYARGFSGASLEESFLFAPVDAGTGFGAALKGLGDLNGDGLADLAIAALREDAGGAASAGVVRVASTAGAPEVTSVKGVHSTLAGDAVIFGTNLLGNLSVKIDGELAVVTPVTPLEANVSLTHDQTRGYHTNKVRRPLRGVNLPEGLVRYPALKAPDTLALGDDLVVDLDNGEPGAFVLAFSSLKYATPAPFENFGWYYGLELNGVWMVAAGGFAPGATARTRVLAGTSAPDLLGTTFYLQAWTLQTGLGLAGFSNTVETTMVP